MKHNIATFIFIFNTLIVNIIAQSPLKFTYQALIRDVSGEVVSEGTINVKVSILEGNADGSPVYEEYHENVATNAYGLIEIEIGGGISIDNMSGITWGENSFYLSVGIDMEKNGVYKDVGVTQLLSVPYALHSNTSGTVQDVNVEDDDADPQNEIQALTISGTVLGISQGNEIDLAPLQDGTEDADADPLNELQMLNLNGEMLEISNGNSVDLTPLTNGEIVDNQELYIAGSNLGIERGNTVDLTPYLDNTDAQELTVNGHNLSISGGNSVVLPDETADADADPLNEIQTLSLTGTGLGISEGNEVDLSVLQDGVEDADADPSNELQTLTLEGNTLNISQGNSVTLPEDGDADPSNEIQDLSSLKTGSSVSIEITGGEGTGFNIEDADADPANELQELSLTGTSLEISNGNSIDLGIIQDGVEDADADVTNELQTLSVDGNQLTISDGNTVTLPGGGDGDLDGDPTNELQDLSSSKTGTSVSIGISDGIGTEIDISDNDADPSNEIQALSKSGNTISLSDGGGSITDAVDDADNDPANELQDLQDVLSRGNSAGNGRITNLSDPVNDQDVATKAFVDQLMTYIQALETRVTALEENSVNGTVTDSEGNVYPTIKIGNQVWMAENLNIGTRINSSSNQTNNGVIEKYCVGNIEEGCETEGGLYLWNELMNYSTGEGSQGICPSGWHVPTDQEWKELEMSLGMSETEANNTGYRGNDEGSDLKVGGISGFEARFAGVRYSNGNFLNVGSNAYFFTSSSKTSNEYWRRELDNSSMVYRDVTGNDEGLSVRCIKD